MPTTFSQVFILPPCCCCDRKPAVGAEIQELGVVTAARDTDTFIVQETKQKIVTMHNLFCQTSNFMKLDTDPLTDKQNNNKDAIVAFLTSNSAPLPVL